MTATLELTKQLIAIPSVTPNDAGCQELIKKRLTAKGFTCKTLQNGKVTNLWAQHGQGDPCLVFAGHTDVVSPGQEDLWHTPPFSPTIKDDVLYGRGAADMKASLAAMIIAAENFVTANPQHSGSIGLMITSGEEGDDFLDGTPKLLDYLQQQQQDITWCIVGEPSSFTELGDNFRVGRRGSMTGHLKVNGKQGHVAYPHLADNPIHRASQIAAQLSSVSWDQGNEFFPATSLQITNIHAGDGSGNVIPACCDLQFNFRFCPESTAAGLQQQVAEIIKDHNCEISWVINGEPFFTPKTTFVNLCQQLIEDELQITPALTTCGGTSDARFIAKTGAEVIELGFVNKTIHQVNECVKISDLQALTNIYEKIANSVL